MVVKSVLYKASDRITCIAGDQLLGQQVIQSQWHKTTDCNICTACSHESSQQITPCGGKRLVIGAHASQAVDNTVSRAHIGGQEWPLTVAHALQAINSAVSGSHGGDRGGAHR